MRKRIKRVKKPLNNLKMSYKDDKETREAIDDLKSKRKARE